MDLKPCPHCGSPAKFAETYGNMRSFPSLDIVCSKKECYGSMHVTYDEFNSDVKDLKRKMAKCWNSRVGEPKMAEEASCPSNRSS